MPLGVARKLLPPNAIIGVSCTAPEHARKAAEEGADYVGLGAVYATSTKDVSAPGAVCGIAGVRAMLGVLEGTGVKAVAIGSCLFLPLPFTLPFHSMEQQWHGTDARVAQAVSNRRICFARCTAALLPLATAFMVLLSCQTL
jgi:thiamine-phosphate diphosphorylase/hydroxyethylthiazole kinase